ncbi:hypothetical protein ACET3Z_030199 [Daucus carota]
MADAVISFAVENLGDFLVRQDGQASLEQGRMDRFLNCICICKKEAQLYDIGNDIESLKKRIGVIKERRLEFGIDTILAGPDVKQKERTLIRASAIDKHVDVVGLKEDIKKLTRELNREDPALKIISIHGLGGLGKTSLATKLYNSNELKHFGTRAKVSVSSDYNIKDVLKRIIKSFKGPEHEQYMSNIDEHDLLQYLPKLLQNQGCYLVLIDDIWDINAWNQIKIAFPDQDNGSRIIITTRNKKVAETVDRNGLAYQLRFLREEESWELFWKTAQPTQNLENLGRQMVGKCGGLPLAIVILGGLLFHDKSYEYWSKIEDSQLNGEVWTCRVHDLVRELAIRKAREQKKLVIFDSSTHQPNLTHLLEGQRRHAIYDEIGEYLKLLEQRRFDALYLHSLVLEGYNGKVELKEMKLIHIRFKNLTVLDMSSAESERVPEELGELVHLKFLGLVASSEGKTIAVPASIGKLKKLRSLWGKYNDSSYTIPKEIWELPELRHLCYIFIKISGRLNIGSHQTKLHSFYNIDFDEWVKIDTVNFTNLRTLYIREREGGEGRTFESIANLTNLQRFLFECDKDVVVSTLKPFSVLNRLKSITLRGVIELSEFCFLPDSVEDLTLSESGFTEDPMPSLGNLRNLATLDLDEVYEGNKMVCSKNAFPSLQILRLQNFTNLKELQVEDGALPCLKSFRTVQCEELRSIPVQKEAQLYDIGNDIESLKKRIGVIKERRLEYGIDTILAGPDLKQKERTFIRASAIDNKVDVVGFKEDIDELMKELNSEDPPLKIISIHGMGGSGKTSLALKLYNSNELRHFGTRAKVCVSNEYTIKDVLKRIIKSFKGPEHEQYMSNMDERDLLQYLPQLLENEGCYLVLIDDIWDIKAWNQIKIAFPNQENGSRIMITTRIKKVAETVDKNGLAYQLRLLREEESWELFCKTAEPTQNLENLGREMVGKCRGLPLAIVILGGLLLHNKSYDYWSKVKEHIWRNLTNDSVDIVEILSLSYKDLSPQMKDCFLYLARFPEDHIIIVDCLKQLWIAEEFISEDEEGDGVLKEDLAEDCLNELINRNLIQIEYLQLNGKVLTCRVHDLVRELAIRKAKEQKNLVIFDSSKHQPNLTHLLEGQRRHAIFDGIGEYLKLLEQRRFDALYLHSLVVEGYNVKVELKEMKLIYTRFKNLTVLDMSSVESDKVPEELVERVLLKYLGLVSSSEGKTIAVPSSIGKLKKLRSLRGGFDDSSYTIPKEIWELPELRHLHYIFIKISGRLNIGSHQTKLHSFHDREGGDGRTFESIANLTNLQTFLFEWDNDVVISTLKPFSVLNRLKSITLNGVIELSEFCFLPDSVEDLTLSCSGFSEDPMPSLGNLRNLTTLDLDEVYEGNKMVCSKNAFPSLQILRLENFTNLKELQVEDLPQKF